MSDERMISERVRKITESSVKERRSRQHHILKLWDQGQLTHRQCIDNIIELEKMIYLGPAFKGAPRKGVPVTTAPVPAV